MKIAAIVSVVAAGRQGRDAQTLFDSIFDVNGDSRNTRSGTDGLAMTLSFYLGNSGLVQFLQIPILA